MNFSEHQIQRYARHILLPEVGGEGQSRLLDSSVLVVGAGGLGSPVLLYLAAAGIGRDAFGSGNYTPASEFARLAHEL